MTHQVSIVTRTKNRTNLLKRCLLSVASQAYKGYQHVIVNDGGNPEEVERAIDQTLDSRERLLVIHNEKSLGLGGASNKGIANSAGDYIVILDDDDTVDAHYFTKMVARLSAKRLVSYGGVVCRTRVIHERMDGDVATTVGGFDFNPDLKEMLLVKLAVKNLFNPNAFLFERRCLESVGAFREDLPVLDDWDFNLRFLSKFDIDVLPESLANWHWRIGPNSQQTITSGQGDHVMYTNHLRNQWLREDIAAGCAGLGFLTNVGMSILTLEQNLVERTHILSPLNKIAKKMSRS